MKLLSLFPHSFRCGKLYSQVPIKSAWTLNYFWRFFHPDHFRNQLWTEKYLGLWFVYFLTFVNVFVLLSVKAWVLAIFLTLFPPTLKFWSGQFSIYHWTFLIYVTNSWTFKNIKQLKIFRIKITGPQLTCNGQ